MIHNPSWLINKYPNDLKAQVMELMQRGYVITAQTEKTAQLMRRRHFSCLIATFFFLFFILPFFIYLFYYLSKRDDVVYLDLDTQNPDPHWRESELKRTKQRNLWVLVGLGLVFLLSFASQY